MTSPFIEKICEFDSGATQKSYGRQAQERIKKLIAAEETIDFISFTCSTINSQYLFNRETPWLYVNTDPAGNNLTADMARLEKILKELRYIYPKISLRILIGNTDPYYIYLQQFKNFPDRQKELWSNFALRWEEYKNALQDWIQTNHPSLQATVDSWYTVEKNIEKKTYGSFEDEYENTLKQIEDIVSSTDLEWELSKLKTHFGPGKYFENLTPPEDSLLRDWVRRKFAEYAVQGLWIYEQFPQSVLLQNEKPTELRSRMYQPLIQKKYSDLLPILHLFGVDNTGYQ